MIGGSPIELLKILIQDEGKPLGRAPQGVAPPAMPQRVYAPEAVPLRPGERRSPDLDAAFGIKPQATPAHHAPEAAPAPEPTPAAPASPLADDNWYQRYHELQNRFDRFAGTSKKLSDAENAELERLRQRLQDESNKPPPKAPPSGGGTATPTTSGPIPPFPPKPGSPTAPPGPALPPTLEDAFYGPPTPRPRPPKLEDFGFRPTATPVPPKPPLPVANPAGTQAIKDLIPPKLGAAAEAFGVDTAGLAASAARAAPALGSIAAAAGPAAAAMLIVDQATKAVVGGLGKMERAVDATGKGLAQLAAGDGAGAVTTAFQSVTSAMDEAGPILKILSAEMKLAVAPVRAMGAVASAFVNRAKEIGIYDSRIAGANDQAELRRTLADIKEAQTLGKDLARVTNAESHMEVAARDALLPVRQLLVKITAGVEERIAGILERVVPIIEKIGEVADFWYRNGPKQAIEAAEAVEKGLTDIYDQVAEMLGIEKKKQTDVDVDLMKQVLNMANEPAMPIMTDGTDGNAAVASNKPPIFDGK